MSRGLKIWIKEVGSRGTVRGYRTADLRLYLSWYSHDTAHLVYCKIVTEYEHTHNVNSKL